MHAVPLFTLIPFVLMLLAIAILPLFKKTSHWWENNTNKLLVSLILGVPTAVYLIMTGLSHNLIHQIAYDYVPFIILLGALFVITGGINLSGDIKATPHNNAIFLAIGYVMASIMGTTGAAMLLIRPLISVNSQRKYKVHTILFFIAMVANCGGLLTPLGDPPLFMLYLRGAPFEWFMKLTPQWLFTGVIFLILYLIVDTIKYKKEPEECLKSDNENIVPLRMTGNINFLFLICVVASVAFINPQKIPAMNGDSIFMQFLREIVLLMLIALSLIFTKKQARKANEFTFAPIIEVAYLFLGIFITMTPALIFLKANAADLGFTNAAQFYYATGALSSFLDNTPTALAFHNVALGLPESIAAAQQGITDSQLVFNGETIPFMASIPESLLKAICISSVFFGSMTYIGNGPNFMVKAIAEENGITMPDFFKYMYKFSLIVCLPIYILVQLIFV